MEKQLVKFYVDSMVDCLLVNQSFGHSAVAKRLRLNDVIYSCLTRIILFQPMKFIFSDKLQCSKFKRIASLCPDFELQHKEE